jgi:hypothetical protein
MNTSHAIEVAPCDLPERKSTRDAFGNYEGLEKAKLPAGQSFWPVVLIDGEPSDPDLATSLLARGEAEFLSDFEAATDVIRKLADDALDASEARRYHAVVTAAVKIEADRMQREFAAAPVVSILRGRMAHEFLSIESVASIFGVSIETALAWAGQKYAAMTRDDGGRVVIERSSVGRCTVGNTEIVDPLPLRGLAAPEPARKRRRLLASSAA